MEYKNNFRNSILFCFFSTLWKITVGGFVNQLIKKFWPKLELFNKTWCCSVSVGGRGALGAAPMGRGLAALNAALQA